MNKRFLSIALVSAFLVGCGGHNFEGEWKASFDSALTKSGSMDRFASMMGSNEPLVIGDDYIERGGQRLELEIFERESAGKKYLVMKTESGDEDVFTIVDDNTLYQGTDLISVTYKRVNR